MRNILLALCLSGATAAAGAAFAQSEFATQREADLRDQITAGLDAGDLSYSQAAQLRTELRQIERLDARYSDEGMAAWQERDLHSRLSLLDSRLNYDLNTNRGDDDSGY